MLVIFQPSTADIKEFLLVDMANYTWSIAMTWRKVGRAERIEKNGDCE